MKGKLYAACVRSGTLYGYETWPVRVEDVDQLKQTDADG